MPDSVTPLDQAHTAMEAAPEDDALRLRFYERLAASELFVLLEAEARGDRVDPMIFPIEGHSYVLVFDREERLSAFVGEPVPYVALSGRRLAETMAGQGLGMGVNLSVAPSSILIPASAVDWLAQTLAHRPTEMEARPEAIEVPGGLPESLLGALDARLASAAGLARAAYLVAVRYAGNRPGHLLAFVDARPGAEGALAQTASEALTFSGIEAGEMDVAFFEASDPICRRLARVGLRFDLPEAPEAPEAAAPAAPGSDPDRPPRLR